MFSERIKNIVDSEIIHNSDYVNIDKYDIEQFKRNVDRIELELIAKYKYLGSTQPDFTMGFNTTLKWKNLTFTAVGDWRHGGIMYSRTANITDTTVQRVYISLSFRL